MVATSAMGVGTDSGAMRAQAQSSRHDAEPATQEPRTIDSFGFWTLLKLGEQPIAFTEVKEREEHSIPFILRPEKARQGPKNWYGLRLHARVVFGDGLGRAYVFASTNGYVAALIKYEATASRGGRKIVRTTASYIDGDSRKTLYSNADDLRFRNFLQYRGVKPGVNQLKFSVERHGELQLKTVQILADSGIDYTKKGPAILKLRVKLPERSATKGHTAVVGVELRNVGDWSIRNMVVNLDYSRTAVRLVGPARRRLGTLSAGSTRHTSFSIVPLRRGPVDIIVSAGGDGGNQSATSRRLYVH